MADYDELGWPIPDWCCDMCGTRTSDSRGHYRFGDRVCDDCAHHPED